MVACVDVPEQKSSAWITFVQIFFFHGSAQGDLSGSRSE
jgi:hypothetical protein